MGRPKGSKNKKGSKFDSIERLLLDTRAVGDCLVWTLSLDQKGYPQSTYNGKAIRVHRWVACLNEGADYEDSRQVRHLCGNPSCINPEHLVLGTAVENNHDRYYTIPIEVWEDIVGLVKVGMTHYQIADLYGIDRTTVGKGLKRYYDRGE